MQANSSTAELVDSLEENILNLLVAAREMERERCAELAFTMMMESDCSAHEVRDAIKGIKC